MTARLRQGILLAFTTALVSGVANFVNKFAVSSVDPLVFTTQKNILVAVFILGVILLLRKLPQIRTLARGDVTKLLAIAVIGGSLPFYLFFSALKEIPAINASLIHKTLVFWVALLAIPLLRERISPLQVAAIGLIYSANLLTGTFKGVSLKGPELMVLLATWLWAIENVIAKLALRRVDPDIVVGARMGLGSLILLFAVLVTGKGAQLLSFASPAQFLLTLATSFLLMGYVSTWYRALRYAPITLVTTILTPATLVTNFLSAAFVTHTFGFGQYAELIFVVSGLWYFMIASRRLLAVPTSGLVPSESSRNYNHNELA